jgi:type VI secretion system secreted protein Hcp
MAIYMKYGSIKGAVTTEGFKDWIELGSCQMGSGRGIGTARAGSPNRVAGEATLSEVVCTKDWDAVSSSKLFEESVKGELTNDVEIHFTIAGTKKVESQLIVKLSKTAVSSYSVSGSGGAGSSPMESFSLNFSKIEIIPKILKENQAPTDGTKVSYDLETGKAN